MLDFTEADLAFFRRPLRDDADDLVTITAEEQERRAKAAKDRLQLEAMRAITLGAADGRS
jgi:hypothetical protein